MREDEVGRQAAAVPLKGFDPTIALASTLHSSSTTAVLLGSGMSRSAGVPTGFEVMVDLVQRYMRAGGLAVNDEDPLTWWASTMGSEARYDEVLKALAPTDASRRDLLREYFERDATGAPLRPSEGHAALAALAAQGRVQIIVTTNFDRLIEQALQAAGVQAQVVSHPSAVKGMTPLPHAGVTVIKLHGDYAGGPLLNSPDELATYAPPWKRLLNRVFDEYGLVVVGWSGEYDVALTNVMNETVGRRHAWYWANYKGQMSEAATRLVTNRGAHVIETAGADDFLTGLSGKVEALDQTTRLSHGARPSVPLNRPSYVTPPPGWTDVPLVHVRVVTSISPVTIEESGRFDSRLRRVLVGALDGSAIHSAAAALIDRQRPASTAATQSAGQPAGLVGSTFDWVPADDYQSTANATYLLGATGGPGTSVRVQVSCPRVTNSAQLMLTIDVGLSFVAGVSVATLADVMRAALVTLGNDLLPVVGDLAPPHAGINRVEVHWDSPTTVNGMNRPVPEANRVHLSDFGDAPSMRPGPKSYAEVPPSGTPLDVTSAGVVLRALETIMLDSGHLDPDDTLADIRAHLGGQGT